jgi:hypothetical protein
MSIKIQNGNLDVTSSKGTESSRIATSPGLIELTVEDSYNSYEIDFDTEGLNILVPAINIAILNSILNIKGVPEYADNAAALAGGLTRDNIYKTATGELRIVYSL